MIQKILSIHIFLMSVSFVVFFLSFLGGVLFLIQESQLKNHRLRPFLAKLPPLETLDQIYYKALAIGFLFLSLGILTGALLSKIVEGAFFSKDPRQLASLIIWGLYALFLNMRIQSGWRGRRGILLSLLGFLGVILTFVAIQHRI